MGSVTRDVLHSQQIGLHLKADFKRTNNVFVPISWRKNTKRNLIVCSGASRPFQSSSQEGKPEFIPSAATFEAPVAPQQLPVDEQVIVLRDLVKRLQAAPSYNQKLEILLKEPSVQTFFAFGRGASIRPLLSLLSQKQAYAIACVPAIGQSHIFELPSPPGKLFSDVECFSGALAAVDTFYDSIGGLPGYQLQCLELIAAAQKASAEKSKDPCSNTFSTKQKEVEYLIPTGVDLSKDAYAAQARQSITAGILGTPHMAEIYPLGGAGDRLGLKCEATGSPLPTAMLEYCGRSLLENLLRDLQAREYLYFKLTGEQHTTPVAVMTSAAKGNHGHVLKLLKSANWFGRGMDSFRLFQQPMVPMVAATDGRWLPVAPLQVQMKPGGHGAIWKLMLDYGVFDWLAKQKKKAAIIRQISNPMAGQDTTLLALAGEGLKGDRAFGFASCDRVVGAAEGMNVLLRESADVQSDAAVEGNRHHNGNSSNRMYDSMRESVTGRSSQSQTRAWNYRITNIEYTEFSRLGIEDVPAGDCPERGPEVQLSYFPANTNVLYIGLSHVESVVRECVSAGSTEAILPGMILNLSKDATYIDHMTGEEKQIPAGRLECTMQNIADCFNTTMELDTPHGCIHPEDLSTFLVYGQRRKVTSSAKRKVTPGSTKIHQTPDGSFYDLLRNAGEMLSLGGTDVPDVGSVAHYLKKGPGFMFLFNPAMGPLWGVVAQKIRGGSLAPGSEVQLEIAEASLENVHVDGSLLVHADNVTGWYGDALHSGEEEGQGQRTSGIETKKVIFGDRCARLRLRNVRISNRGVDYDHPENVYWKHKVARKESCRVVLHGNAEFDAADVELTGDKIYKVPDGHKMVLRSNEHGDVVVGVEELPNCGKSPTWRWKYILGGDSQKEYSQNGCVNLHMEEL